MEEMDSFERFLKEQLEGKESPVSDRVWKNIQSSLPPEDKKESLRPVYFALIGLIMIVSGIFYFNDKNYFSFEAASLERTNERKLLKQEAELIASKYETNKSQLYNEELNNSTGISSVTNISEFEKGDHERAKENSIIHKTGNIKLSQTKNGNKISANVTNSISSDNNFPAYSNGQVAGRKTQKISHSQKMEGNSKNNLFSRLTKENFVSLNSKSEEGLVKVNSARSESQTKNDKEEVENSVVKNQSVEGSEKNKSVKNSAEDESNQSGTNVSKAIKNENSEWSSIKGAQSSSDQKIKNTNQQNLESGSDAGLNENASPYNSESNDLDNKNFSKEKEIQNSSYNKEADKNSIKESQSYSDLETKSTNQQDRMTISNGELSKEGNSHNSKSNNLDSKNIDNRENQNSSIENRSDNKLIASGKNTDGLTEEDTIKESEMNSANKESEKEEHTKKKKNKEFSMPQIDMEVFLTPTISKSHLSQNVIGAEEEMNNNNAKFSLGAGVRMNINISEKFKAGLGLQYSSYGDRSVIKTSSDKDLVYVNYNIVKGPNGAWVYIPKDTVKFKKSFSDKQVAVNSFKYISIPVFAGYRVLDGKFGVTLTGGFTTNILTYAETNTFITNSNSAVTINTESSKGSSSPFRPLVFSVFVSPGLSYRINDNMRIILDPGFTWFLNSVYKSDYAVGRRIMALECRTGVQFTLGK